MRGQFNASLSVQVQELKRTMQNRDKRRSSDQRHRRVRAHALRASSLRHTPLSCAELESPSAGRRGRPVRCASGAAEQHRRRRARARRGGELGGRHGGSARGPPHPALRPMPGRARTRHLTLPQLGRRAGPEQRPCCAGRFSSRLSPRPAAPRDPSRPEQSSCQRGSALPQQRRQRPCARGASPCSSLRLR